jgi:gluconate 2-dehydrogenase gamma chain
VTPEIDRRAFLRLGRDLALLALFPGGALAQLLSRPTDPGGAGYFLSPARMATLRALCAHFIPGPPEDPDPGALEAGVPVYIDLLLGAFEVELPPIFARASFGAGGPGGGVRAAEFLGLDAIEERVWRTRIEGSRGLPEREWNGPVKGLQEIYADGLDALDGLARRWMRRPFHELGSWQRDLVLWWAGGDLEAFVDLAFRHSVEGMYGSPAYRGNRDRVGWRNTHWPGDAYPPGYHEEQIARPDPDQAEAVARSRARAQAQRGREPRDG